MQRWVGVHSSNLTVNKPPPPPASALAPGCGPYPHGPPGTPLPSCLLQRDGGAKGTRCPAGAPGCRSPGSASCAPGHQLPRDLCWRGPRLALPF